MKKQTLLEGLRALPGDESLLRTLASLLEAEGNWQELQQIMLEQLPRLPRVYRARADGCAGIAEGLRHFGFDHLFERLWD